MRRCIVRSRKTLSALAALLVACGGSSSWVAPAPARGEEPACRPAEIFATNNTAVSTDPDSSQSHDQLQLFEMQAATTIAQNGAAMTGSRLVNGVLWSDELHQNTYERSREFHVCVVDAPTLHNVAEALRNQFDQGSVLTFEYLPQGAPAANAFTIDVPDIDAPRLGQALMADAVARDRLLGGSITTDDHTLILAAGNDDVDIARRLVNEAGGCWRAATITYGRRELVET
ncbi:hypothetical protein [Mycobacterium marinum]|uniref:hypothetical protein n=1 Tax=Mycobacterium marinum TaxID=1781 RepID=UPI000E3D1A5C|nr:hypothetical protein [Mycobacterium marinum]RFZ45703.1 hypothetical protein KST_00241 [Mycobacterium marinum]